VAKNAAKPELTLMQLYGYRVAWNLIKHNFGQIAGCTHDLFETREVNLVWRVSMPLTATRIQRRKVEGVAILELEFSPAGAVIYVYATTGPHQEQQLTNAERVDYETLFPALPAIMKRLAGLKYPADDEDPPL
jgi:hypothetical protein